MEHKAERHSGDEEHFGAVHGCDISGRRSKDALQYRRVQNTMMLKLKKIKCFLLASSGVLAVHNEVIKHSPHSKYA